MHVEAEGKNERYNKHFGKFEKCFAIENRFFLFIYRTNVKSIKRRW